MHDHSTPAIRHDDSDGDPHDGSPTGLRVGMVLENTYRLVERIGSGGMADVFVASHSRLAGQFAIKALNRDLTRNNEALVRFGREAAVLSSLRHPNVVQVFDFNVSEDGTPYLVMELLGGRDLRRALDDTPQLPPERTARIVRQIASGLAAAHAAGVVHRDLKPANVVLIPVPGAPDFVKVLDFGISKVTWSVKLTLDAAIMGTPEYMAPEQAEGRAEAIDHLTDQFALAAMTYALLAGRDPFRAETPLAVLYQVIHAEPEPLGRFVSWPAAGVDAVLRRALSKQPQDRYPDVLAFAEALEIAVRESGVWVSSALSAVMLPRMEAARPTLRRHAQTSVVGVAAAAAGVLLGFASTGDAWARIGRQAHATAMRAWPGWDVGALADKTAGAMVLPTASVKLAAKVRDKVRAPEVDAKDCGQRGLDAARRAAQDACMSGTTTTGWQPVLDFWMGDPAQPWGERTARWFRKDPAFDREIARRFGELIEQASRGELDAWRADAPGALALIILLDQMPRNAFRDTPRAFAQDARALAVATEAHARGLDRALTVVERALLAMPFMHAEDRGLQTTSVATFAKLAKEAEGDALAYLTSASDYAVRHQEIVERFGRYPHRNAILGRASTAEEEAFLELPGSRF